MANKYDSFYSDLNNKYYDIDTLKNINFELKQKDHMYCPICKKAKLIYYHESSSKQDYLATNPNSEHDKNCINNYEQISAKAMNEYIEKLKKNPQKMKDKLDSFGRILFPQKFINKGISTENNEENPLIINEQKKSNTAYRKIIRTKSLRELDINDKTIYLYYLGNVNIKKCKPIIYENKKLYSLNIYKNGKYICTIQHGEINDNIDENKLYNIWFFGEISEKKEYPLFKCINNMFIFEEV